MNGTVPRLGIAVVCLVGVVLGGAYAPAVGIDTPIPDLGVEDSDDGPLGEELLSESQSGESQGDSGEINGDAQRSGGEFIDDPEMDEDGVPRDSGAENYGGVSSGGFPEKSTVGGPLSLSDHVELRVESPEPSRWRLGAYETYTGDSWERHGSDPEPLDGPLSTVNGDTSVSHNVRVTPERSFETLVTTWRPAFAEAPARDVLVTEDRRFIVSDPVTAGETYVTSTYGPPSHQDAKLASGTGSVPNDIQDRYTQLPDDTSERLQEHTAEITADAETSYETAAAVQSWLMTNKEYSLDAEHDRDQDVATAFVFQMEAGYCEYFATSMVAMLRSQDVPARYVTGYSPGEEAGEDEYIVRGQHAHAWVEVYIADIGWVTFDPTPSSDREEADRDDVPPEYAGPSPDDPETSEDDGPEHADGSDPDQDETDEDETDEDETDDDEANEDENGDNEADEDKTDGDETDDDETDEDETDEDLAPLEITLAQDPVPGRDLTVTVTRDGEPVPDAAIFFNDDLIGETDAAGNVTGEVPYVASLEVVVRSDGSEGETNTIDSKPRFPSIQASTSSPSSIGASSVWFSAGSSPISEAFTDSDTIAQTNENVTVDVPVDVDIEVRGEPIAGEPIDIVATVSDEPVRDATVRFNGTEVAQTGVSGEATADLPDTEVVEINVSRGEVSGNRTLSVSTFEVTVSPGTVIALPLMEAVVTTTLDDDPVENATVAIDGEPVAVTGSEGSVETPIPLADTATFTATADLDGISPTATTTVDDLYRNLGLTLGVALLGLGAVARRVRRSNIALRSVPHSAVRVAVRLFRAAIAGIVGAASTIDTMLSALRRGAHHAISLLRGGINGVSQLVRTIAGGVRRGGRRVAALFRSLPQRLHPYVLFAMMRRLWRSDSGDGSATDPATTAQTGGSEDDEDVLTLREAWAEFRGYVSIRSWRTATPGEIARWAVRRDELPREPVQTITDAFRDVEYGSRVPDDRVPAARQALKQLRARDEEENEGDDP